MSTPEHLIGESAKTCYSTKKIDDGGKDITHNLVHGLQHLAVLRFAYATFDIRGISVACQNQLVRSKHLDFMVQSKRYVSASKGNFSFVMPKNLNKEQQDIARSAWDFSIDTYNMLLNSGAKKEDARSVLPANTSTDMMVTGNLQAMNDFFKLRLSSHAQEEIRDLANEMYTILQEKFPQVFTDALHAKYKGEPDNENT